MMCLKPRAEKLLKDYDAVVLCKKLNCVKGTFCGFYYSVVPV